MESQQQADRGLAGNRRIPLQLLVDGLVGNSLPVARLRRSAVMNEVGRGVSLRSLDEPLHILIGDVLSAVITNSRDGDIHIRCSRRQDHFVLTITDKSNYNGYALSFSIGALARDAGKMGCFLSIENPTRLVTTISLSFPGIAA